MYMVMTSQEKMPAKVMHKYMRIALVEFDPANANVHTPKIISPRTKGLRILHEWRKLFVGKTGKCAYSRAMHEAYNMMEILR